MAKSRNGEFIERAMVKTRYAQLAPNERASLWRMYDKYVVEGKLPTDKQVARVERYFANHDINFGVDTVERSALYRQLNYQRRTAEKHVNQLKEMQQTLYKGTRSTEFSTLVFPEWLDWNTKNKYQRMSIDELNGLLEEMKLFNKSTNGKRKRGALLLRSQMFVLGESLKNEHISPEEFFERLRVTWRNAKAMGITKADFIDLLWEMELVQRYMANYGDEEELYDELGL